MASCLCCGSAENAEMTRRVAAAFSRHRGLDAPAGIRYSRGMHSSIILITSLAATVASLRADGAFYGDPPDENHPWAIHDMNRPQPPRVEPGSFSTQQEPGKPPSDAVVLFSGAAGDIEKWVADKNPPEPTKWEVVDGVLQCKPGAGYIRTKEEFGDCQLHVEWSAPAKVEGNSQGRGNSGVFLMGQVEVQVLDNYNNPTYADGFAGSVYGVNPPAANSLRAPGEWQVYDIIFRRPIWKDGKEIESGYLTVFINGVLVQDHSPLEGGGGHMGRSKARPFPEKGPLKIQDHGNPVRFRNIWYRSLPKRAVEGNTNGFLTPEAASAKRAEIAAEIRTAAAKLQGNDKMYKLLESLCYEANDAAKTEGVKMAGELATAISGTAADKLEGRKGEAKQLRNALKYLAKKAKVLPEDLAPLADLEKLIAAREWDKK